MGPSLIPNIALIYHLMNLLDPHNAGDRLRFSSKQTAAQFVSAPDDDDDFGAAGFKLIGRVPLVPRRALLPRERLFVPNNVDSAAAQNTSDVEHGQVVVYRAKPNGDFYAAR